MSKNKKSSGLAYSLITAPKIYTIKRGGPLDIIGSTKIKTKKNITSIIKIYDIYEHEVLSLDVCIKKILVNGIVIENINLEDLQGGVYSYRLYTSDILLDDPQYFIIYDPNSSSKVAIMHPLFTWQAYNVYGGESFYRGAQFDNTKKIELTLERPLTTQSDYHRPESTIPTIRLLEKNGIKTDSICNLTLHETKGLLDKYDLLILVGHDEYWTHTMYDQLEDFVRAGGNVVAFAANILCWAIEVENGNIRVDKRNQYIEGESGSNSSGHFRNPWINRQQQSLFGLAYWYAGYPVSRIDPTVASQHLTQDQIRNSGAIHVIDMGHQIFSGVKIDNGKILTTETNLLDVELDGVFISKDKVDFTRTVDVPKNTKVLAKSIVNVAHTRVNQNGKVTSDVSFETVGIITECSPYPKGGVTLQLGSVCFFRAAKNPSSNEAKLMINMVKYATGAFNEP